MLSATAYGAFFHHHTDGVEPYYHPKELELWMSTVPEELHSTLFAKEGAMDWWLDARFGIFVKSSWGLNSKDKEPWLQIQLDAPKSVSQIKLMEGKFGSASRVQQYVVEANVSGDWKTVHSGGAIGGDCNILLKSPVESDLFRLRILKWDGYMDLNSVELYE